jgi:hypothetical protein
MSLHATTSGPEKQSHPVASVWGNREGQVPATASHHAENAPIGRDLDDPDFEVQSRGARLLPKIRGTPRTKGLARGSLVGVQEPAFVRVAQKWRRTRRVALLARGRTAQDERRPLRNSTLVGRKG